MLANTRLLTVLACLVLVAAACDWPWQAQDSTPTTTTTTPEQLPFNDNEADEQAVDEPTTTTESTTSEGVDIADPVGPREEQPVTSEVEEPIDSSPTPRPTPSTTETTGQTSSTPSTTESPTTDATATTEAPVGSPRTTPTTAAPTTAAPTTAAPATAAPTTAAPTTATPTTPPTTAPTTAAPTTATPTTAAPTTAAPGPVLVWSDEFDSFNANRWKKEHSTYGDGGRTLQCYTPQQVSVANGSLVLTAEKRTETCPNTSPYGSTRDYTAGMVRSKDVTFSPGQRIVYRVKLTPNDEANQGGLWPALWTSGWAGGGWPTGGEWDGFEVMTAVDPTRTVFGLHFANDLGNHAKSSESVFSSENFSANWHVMEFDYGIDGEMTWRMDGELMAQQSGLNTLQGWPAPFDEAMKELKINLALGGSPGPLDDRALPATYQIDYVRIYDLP